MGSDFGRNAAEIRRRRLLDAVRAFTERDGAVPGIRRFADEVGEKRHVFQGHLWPSWGAFLSEAGLVTRDMTQAVPADELMARLAALTREHGRFPTNAQLRYAHSKVPKFPTEKVFRARFGGLPAMLSRLREWVESKPEYADVQAALAQSSVPSAPLRAPELSPEGAQTAVDLGDSFVPPVVDCLPALAAGDAAVERLCAERGRALNVEFERRVAAAFQLLGLDVTALGQGAGRVADGIARCRAGRWAIVYDAKVRRGGFVMGTEDRKFREYVERHASELERDGVNSVYFAIVSSSFESSDLEKAREVTRLTRAKACVLVEASALRALVELKLRTRLLDDWAAMERLFARSEVLGLAEVNALEK